MDLSRFNIHLPEFRPVQDQIKDKFYSIGITPPETIQIDGQLHRFSTNDKKHGDDSGYYVIHDDGIIAGTLGDWRTGQEVIFRADVGRELTASEHMQMNARITESRKIRDEETRRKHEHAAETVAGIWEDASPSNENHPYLIKKGIQSHGVRVYGDGRLIAPMYNDLGELSSIQYIGVEKGNKRFHPGGKAGGCFWILGDIKDIVYICEGFATAATVRETMDCPAVVAFSASSLPAVTETIRKKYPLVRIFIVADNDVNGTGQMYASQASTYGATVIIPPIPGMDANDYRSAGHNLKELLSPKKSEWLVSADEWASEQKHIEWHIKGWIQKESTMMVFGPPGCGKSFLVLDWGLRMASGLSDWQGCKVKESPVVYLAGEGHQGLRGRIAAWKQKHCVSAGKFWLSKSGTDLNLPGPLAETIACIESLPEKPGLIIVDTLHRFLNGDENSPQDSKTMLDACAMLRAQFRCTVLLVHHTGVSLEAQGRGRGSSSWKGAMDVELCVRSNDSGFSIEQSKVKDSEEKPPVFLELESVNIDGWFDEDGEQVTSAVVITGVEKAKKEKNPKKISLFLEAWKESGEEKIEGKPYLTKSFLEVFLTTKKYAKTTINNYLRASKPGSMITDLIVDGIISAHLNGWIIIDKVIISQCNIV